MSTISAITAIQADAMFKIKNLPDFKIQKSENQEQLKKDGTHDGFLSASFDKKINISESSMLNKHLKN
ncbi:MAG: hypothetical protein ACT4N5_06785 [Nitrosopumilaceae archaeon]